MTSESPMWRRVGLALAIELVLGAIALQGGPHGSVGPWSWMLQLPGLLILFVPPADTWMVARLAVVFAVQAGLWFAALTLIARLLARHRPA